MIAWGPSGYSLIKSALISIWDLKIIFVLGACSRIWGMIPQTMPCVLITCFCYEVFTLWIVNHDHVRIFNRSFIIQPESFRIFIWPVNKDLLICFGQVDIRRSNTLENVMELSLGDIKYFRLRTSDVPCIWNKLICTTLLLYVLTMNFNTCQAQEANYSMTHKGH